MIVMVKRLITDWRVLSFSGSCDNHFCIMYYIMPGRKYKDKIYIKLRQERMIYSVYN